jgi:site-specific recombinase XerD
MKDNRKLYTLTNRNFVLPYYIDENRRPITREADDIPMMCWPDGTWCLPANVFMLDLYHRGRSRRNRGGTLHTYATSISHLLRFCFDNKISLSNINDNQFTLFMRTLQGENRVDNISVRKRNANSLISIGRCCLSFLDSVSKLYNLDNFLHPSGQIRSDLKEYRFNIHRRNNRSLGAVKKYWHHHSFPKPTSKDRRLPITTESIDRLRDAIQTSTKSIYLRKRRYLLLKLLEITGGRRSEIAALTVSSVRAAAEMSHPMLKLINMKRGPDNFRFVPISRHDVHFLCEFIEKNRLRVIRATCGMAKDDDSLLISMQTGQKLMPNTITQELSLLRRHANIEEEACAHMFRHRFITKLFVALIEQHEFENPDGVRRAILDTQSFKQKIQQWTGHADINSLDIYINLAFEECADFSKTINLVQTQCATESFKASLKQFKTELLADNRSRDTVARLSTMIDDFFQDLEISGKEVK